MYLILLGGLAFGLLDLMLISLQQLKDDFDHPKLLEDHKLRRYVLVSSQEK